MKDARAPGRVPGQGAPGLGKTFIDDLFRGDLKRTLSRDLHDLYHFYLDEEARKRITRMGAVHKLFSVSWWLLKSLILKLPPLRRLMLLLSIWLFLMGDITFRGQRLQIDFHFGIVSFVIVLVILMLELKDKLLARDELAVGRAVQLALMPTANPTIEGWEIWLFTRPANDVGGDLVDSILLKDGRLGLVLGDVSGKGLGAALLMAKLQATLRAFATEGDSLADLGGRVNRILCRDGLPGRFATLVFLELDPRSGSIRLLNAGHMPPYVVRDDGVQSLPSVAPVVGILPEASYVEQALDLAPGSMLLIYSDGLTEAMNGKEEFFGEERLYGLLPGLRELSPKAAGERLLVEVARFVGDERYNDDLSLIVIKRSEEPLGN